MVFPIMFHFRQGRQVLLQKKVPNQRHHLGRSVHPIRHFDHESAGSGYEVISYHVVRAGYDAQKLLNENIS